VHILQPHASTFFLLTMLSRNLTTWANNGVLLLNTCLTVRAHQANSHSNRGWEQFTEKIIDIVCTYGGATLSNTGVGKGIVFLAWGSPAAKRLTKVDKVSTRIFSFMPHAIRANSVTEKTPDID